MTEPTNNGGWQDVPNSTGATPGVPPAAGSGYPPPQQGYPPPPQGYATPQASGLSANAAAAISYITFIPAVIFLVMEPYKRIPFVRFHSIQSIALFVLSVIVSKVINLFFFSSVLGGAWALGALVHMLVSLAFFILWIVCVVSAAQGKWFKIPLLGDMALKMAQGQ